MNIEPIQATLGATVTGVNLNALDNDQWQAVEAAWYEYAVLVFLGQHIEEEAHIALGERIGPLEELMTNRKAVPISNRKADGSSVDPNSDHFQILKATKAGIRIAPTCRCQPVHPFWLRMWCPRKAGRLNGQICGLLLKPWTTRLVKK